MAPTICSEKDFRTRTNRRVEKSSASSSSTRYSKNSQYQQTDSLTNSTTVINYAGKPKRLSLAARNAKSIKHLQQQFRTDNLKKIYSDSDSIDDVTSTANLNYHHYNMRANASNINNMDGSSNESYAVSSHSQNYSSIRNLHYDSSNNDEINNNLNNLPLNNSNVLSSSHVKRFSSALVNYCKIPLNFQKQQQEAKILSHKIRTTNSLSSFNHSAAISSTTPKLTERKLAFGKYSNAKKIPNVLKQKKLLNNKNNVNTNGLVDIALKTILLIRRNQLLQKKLLHLQVETKEFIASVMSNPENQAICNKQFIKQSSQNYNTNNNSSSNE